MPLVTTCRLQDASCGLATGSANMNSLKAQQSPFRKATDTSSAIHHHCSYILLSPLRSTVFLSDSLLNVSARLSSMGHSMLYMMLRSNEKLSSQRWRNSSWKSPPLPTPIHGFERAMPIVDVNSFSSFPFMTWATLRNVDYIPVFSVFPPSVD